MKQIGFFDAKPYDRIWFDRLNDQYKIKYYENKLNSDTASLAKNCKAVVAFVNDDLDARTINALHSEGVRLIALRCAGYNNVDVKAAYGKINIVRVPAYSPYAVAEHAMTLLLSLNRKIHKAYNRTRDFNFSLNGLLGYDLHGKTVGVIGTGKIGQVFIEICRGFNTQIIAYDPFPKEGAGIDYVPPEELFARSDIISLHCPLTPQTQHIINRSSLKQMKDGIVIINTSRGGLIDSDALLSALKSGKVRGAGLDVYEEESDLFYEDFSGSIIQDDTLALLVSLPNVLITSHQAFLTDDALSSIARTTLVNLDAFFCDGRLENEVCYQCRSKEEAADCRKAKQDRCF